MGEWRSTTLDKLGRIVTGKTPSSQLSDCFDGHIPFVTPSDMDDRRLIERTSRYLTDDGVQAAANSRIPANSVMVSCIGSDMGKAALAGQDCITNQQINSIIVDDGNDPLFVYYYLKTRKEELRAAAGGSAVPILKKSLFGQFQIALPPLNEQRAIAHILGTLDDKIELNRRMNETLEAISRALFKSWFVDFDPVRAKAGGRDTGLPKHLADLFPDSFEDSEFGEIPKGWAVGSLDEEFNLTMGQSPPGETYNESGDGLPFFQGRTDFGFRFPERRVYCTAPTRFAEAGDTLVSVRAPVGDINMATERCCIGRGVAAVRHKTGARSFTYYSMGSQEDTFARFEAEGTVFGSIGKKDFHSLASVTPTEDIVAVFERVVGALDDRLQLNEGQSRTLAALRDTLLPKLISGELRTSSLSSLAQEMTS